MVAHWPVSTKEDIKKFKNDDFEPLFLMPKAKIKKTKSYEVLQEANGKKTRWLKWPCSGWRKWWY